MNGTVERIRLYAKQLKLPSFGEYQSLARDASESHWGYEEFLVELLKTELEHRQANQKQRLIRAARFPLIKTLDCFDFANLKNIDPVVVWDLSGNEYLRRRENIIFIGNPGTGKSHLSIALGLCACQAGFRVRFFSAPALATELVEAQENHTLTKIVKQLLKTDLLILDDLSYLSFSRHQSELLFQIISDRIERASTIVSTNLEFSRWTEFFGDAMLTAALVDRLTHRAHLLDMNGESYRLKQRRNADLGPGDTQG